MWRKVVAARQLLISVMKQLVLNLSGITWNKAQAHTCDMSHPLLTNIFWRFCFLCSGNKTCTLSLILGQFSIVPCVCSSFLIILSCIPRMLEYASVSLGNHAAYALTQYIESHMMSPKDDEADEATHECECEPWVLLSFMQQQQRLPEQASWVELRFSFRSENLIFPFTH